MCLVRDKFYRVVTVALGNPGEATIFSINKRDSSNDKSKTRWLQFDPALRPWLSIRESDSMKLVIKKFAINTLIPFSN